MPTTCVILLWSNSYDLNLLLSLLAGLDPSPSTSTAPVTKKPPAKRPAAPPPPPPSSSISSRRLKQLAEEEQDPTCAAATLRLLRQNLPLPAASRYTYWQVLSFSLSPPLISQHPSPSLTFFHIFSSQFTSWLLLLLPALTAPHLAFHLHFTFHTSPHVLSYLKHQKCTFSLLFVTVEAFAHDRTHIINHSLCLEEKIYKHCFCV